MTSYSSVKPQERFNLGRAWTSIESNLKLLILMGFVQGVAVSLFSSVLMPYFRTLGFGSDAVGSLSSILQVVMVCVGVFAGLLADSLGRKRIYLAGQVFRCLAAALLLVTRSYLGFVVVFALRGLSGIRGPAESAMFAEYTRKENRGTLLGISQTVSQLAAVLGPLAAGAIAERYGVKYSFAGALVLSCLAVVLVIPLKERRVTTDIPDAMKQVEVPKEASEALMARVSKMFKENNPVVLASLMAVNLLNGLANGATGIILPFTIMDRFSSAYTTMSLSESVGALGTMLVLLVGGRIADVYGRRGIVLLSGATFPLLMLFIFMTTSLWQLLAVLFLIVMVGNISNPAIGAVNMEAVVEQDRATFAGFQMSLNSAGAVLGALAAGIGYKLSPTWSWIAAIVLFAVQLPLWAIAIPRERKPVSAQ